MASEPARTGATPDQLMRALRSRAYQSYTKSEMADRAIEKGMIAADTINDTLNGWAPHLVTADECIVRRDDLREVSDWIESMDALFDDYPPALTRLRAAIGTPTAETVCPRCGERTYESLRTGRTRSSVNRIRLIFWISSARTGSMGMTP